MKHLMDTIDMIREVVSEAVITEIPAKYITAAAYHDDMGLERIVSSQSTISDVLNRRGEFEHLQDRDINVFINLHLLGSDMAVLLTDLFAYISIELSKDK